VIVRRTGIRERRIAAPDEFTSDLCTAAARDLFARSGSSPDDVDLVIVGTTTPDYPFPSVACQVQDRLGMHPRRRAGHQATCAGFAYGLHIANGLVSAGVHDRVLVVAGETLSKVTDYTDRATCILFGDAAGAALVESATREAFARRSSARMVMAVHICTGLACHAASPARRAPSWHLA